MARPKKLYLNDYDEEFPSIYHVASFNYNGFMVESKPGFESYTVKSLVKWTTDPGIGLFKCNDKDKLRIIPTCQLHPQFLRKLGPSPWAK